MSRSTLALKTDFEEAISRQISLAYGDNDFEASVVVQKKLALLHAKSFECPAAGAVDFDNMRDDLGLALLIEEKMIEYEDCLIDISGSPDPTAGGKKFVDDLKQIVRAHPANRHEFYENYLPNVSTVEDIAFYLTQESSLDPRFDDFIALMQIGMDIGPKLELALNYWDEMGTGSRERVHSFMFQNVLDELGVTSEYVNDNVMIEAYVCGNLSAALALRKPLVYRAIGSFAVTEFLFPRRCSQLLKAWDRNGLSVSGSAYHQEHVSVDARHAAGFFKNVIIPIVEKNHNLGSDIYWGAMARLNSSQRYLDALMTHFRTRGEYDER